MHAVSDEQLIQWVADGDVSCLGTLFDRHHKGLFHFCWQLTKNEATSEDLVQEVFLKLMRKASTFRNESSFKSWAYLIARNVAFDYLRREKRQLTETDAQPAIDAGLIDERSAEQAAAGQEDLQHLAESLAGLSVDQREIIWLGRCEFPDYRSLADALGCTTQAARVRMHRAMKALHMIYDRLQGGPLDV